MPCVQSNTTEASTYILSLQLISIFKASAGSVGKLQNARDFNQGNPAIHSQYGVNYNVNSGESEAKVIPIKFVTVHLAVNRIARREGKIQYNSTIVDTLRPGQHGGAMDSLV